MSFEFTQPFDGTHPEVAPEEQRAVSQKFSSFVDDIMLNNVSRIHTTDPRINGESTPHSRLILKRLEDDSLTVLVEVSPKSKTAAKYVDLEQIGGDRVSYRLGHDGVVTRFDVAEKKPEETDAETLDGIRYLNGTETPEEGLVASEGLLKHLSEALANDRLEKEMGINDQPIGMDELNSLISLVLETVAK